MVRSSHSRAPSTLSSFWYALRGVGLAFSEERNFRTQCCYGVLVGLLLLWFQPSLLGALLAILSVVLLLSAELANSALERVVDLLSPEARVLAGEAKDMAAAGVMLVSFISALIVLGVLAQRMEIEAILGVSALFLGFIVKRMNLGVQP